MSYIGTAKEIEEVISMHDMKPLQVGIVEDTSTVNHNHVVMRTASSFQFEVMDLTDIGENVFWGADCSLRVRLLAKGKSLNLILCNE